MVKSGGGEDNTISSLTVTRDPVDEEAVTAVDVLLDSVLPSNHDYDSVNPTTDGCDAVVAIRTTQQRLPNQHRHLPTYKCQINERNDHDISLDGNFDVDGLEEQQNTQQRLPDQHDRRLTYKSQMDEGNDHDNITIDADYSAYCIEDGKIVDDNDHNDVADVKYRHSDNNKNTGDDHSINVSRLLENNPESLGNQQVGAIYVNINHPPDQNRGDTLDLFPDIVDTSVEEHHNNEPSRMLSQGTSTSLPPNATVSENRNNEDNQEADPITPIAHPVNGFLATNNHIQYPTIDATPLPSMIENNNNNRTLIICLLVTLVCLVVIVIIVISVYILSEQRNEPAPTAPQPTNSTESPTATLVMVPSMSSTPSTPSSSSSTIIVAPNTNSRRTCLVTTDELRTAVLEYYKNNSTVMAKYGNPIGTWCVEKISDFSYLFCGVVGYLCGVFYNPLGKDFNDDISQWNTSSATDMSHMFYGATSFNGDLSSWDVSRVTNMGAMFGYAESFNGNISSWNVSRVTDMSLMFIKATAFNGDLSSWDVSSVTVTFLMFTGIPYFNGNLSSWDVSRVTDMSLMFNGVASFNTDLSSWDVSRVTTVSGMFAGAFPFSQNLCPWGEILSSDVDVTSMFADTNCPIQTSPNLTATPPGPFCFACT